MKNLCLLYTLLLLVLACSTPIPEEIKNTAASLPETVDFNYHIKPILSDRCLPDAAIVG